MTNIWKRRCGRNGSEARRVVGGPALFRIGCNETSVPVKCPTTHVSKNGRTGNDDQTGESLNNQQRKAEEEVLMSARKLPHVNSNGGGQLQ